MSDELIAEAELGEEARNFVKSQLGILILGQCKQDRQVALEKLSEVDPEDRAKVRAAQNAVRLAEMFEERLVEIITQGDQALNVWKQQQEIV